MAGAALSSEGLALQSLLQSLLPAAAACQVQALADTPLSTLWPAEAAASHGWHPRRQVEFAAGRHAARAVLAALGQAPCDFPPGPQRVPAWPPGVCLSLTHTDGWALAAGLPAPPWQALGLDLALLKHYAPGVVERILHPLERDAQALWPAAVSFCIKEAAYKAQWTLSQAWMDFQDVVLAIEPGRFSAKVVGGRSHPWPLGHSFEGRWALNDRHVVAVALIP